MNILILGSEGFIGRQLVTYFSKKDYQVYGADLLEVGTQPYKYFKITRLSPEFDELLQNTGFDVCINAAGSGNVSYSMTHPVSDFEANSLDTIRLLDGFRRHRPSCKYLHISSAAVYGNPQQLPIKEADSLQPVSPYGWHKLIAEQLCKEFTSVYGLSTAIVRPFSIFGPGLKKQLFWELAQKVINSPEGSTIELWGTGRESRDFLFIDDLVYAIDCILDKGSFRSEVYNIASGIETSIHDVTDVFVKSFGKPVTIRFNQQVRSGDPQNWRADIGLLQSLGFQQNVSIETGINKYVEWLKEGK